MSTRAPTAALATGESGGRAQSLSHGTVGIALLDIERAHRGIAAWEDVHARLITVTRHQLISGEEASLFLGAPAMAYVLHLAAADSDRYQSALQALDGIVAAHVRRRLAAAHARIDQGRAGSFTEYDLLRGLTGLGALLLRRVPDSAELKEVLEYLVRLTEPLPGPDGGKLPGWWVWHSPVNLGAPVAGGHANVGLAHGVSGPLALLALAALRGVTVPGHQEGMLRICRWLDQIRQHDHQGTRWPRWVTQTEALPARPAAPSWCYGTPGLARAQQLAALALVDPDRRCMAERALLHCLTDPRQLDQLTDRGLCHGVAGLLRVVQRVAEDAENPHSFTDHLPHLSSRFLMAGAPAGAGFLEGAAGAALAFQNAEAGSVPASDWDACLLLI